MLFAPDFNLNRRESVTYIDRVRVIKRRCHHFKHVTGWQCLLWRSYRTENLSGSSNIVEINISQIPVIMAKLTKSLISYNSSKLVLITLDVLLALTSFSSFHESLNVD